MTDPYGASPYPSPYPPPPGAPYPPRERTDAGLGWTGLGLALAFCVPLGPFAGGIVSLVALVRGRFRPRWVAVLALLLGLAFTGLQALAVPSIVDGVKEGVEEARTSAERHIDPFELTDGDCIDDPNFNGTRDGGEALSTDIDRIPCDEPHDAEVFATIELEGDDFPGADVIDRRTQECLTLFAGFAGVRYAASSLDVYFYYPTSQTWRLEHDRTIQCVVGVPDEKTTGSLEGAGRGDLPAYGEHLGVDRLVVGDCYDHPGPKDDSDMLVRRPCAKPHEAEAFAVIDFKGTAFPGKASLVKRTEARCTALFGRYVGIAYDDSRYSYEYWTPDAETWAAGDRTSICALHQEGDRPITGSAKGTRR